MTNVFFMYKRKIEKKDLEEYYLKKFVSNSSLGLRIKKIVPSETPDFIIDELNETISIEVMRLIDPKQKEIETLQEVIINEAYKLFKAEFNERLRVLVCFSRSVVEYKKVGVDFLAHELYHYVKSIYLNNRDFEFHLSSKPGTGTINDYFDSVVVSNDLGYENWQPFGAYLVKPIDFVWLNEQIHRKSKNLKMYSEKFDKNWLLLVANIGHRSSASDLINVGKFESNSGFDRIYLYSLIQNEIVLL